MENVFVSDLVQMEKMSNRWTQVKKSLVNGSAAEKGLGNAAKLARSTTQSSVTFSQMMNASGSRMTMRGVKHMNEQEVNVQAEWTDDGDR